MPDPPPDPARPYCSVTATDSRAHSPSDPPYAELHCRTNFSFLEGASHPDELVNRAAQLGYTALAITDRHSVAGVVRAHVAAKEVGLKLLIGAEIAPIDSWPVLLLAIDRDGYGRLTRLLTKGCRRAKKGECRLSFDDLAESAEGLLALVLPWNRKNGISSGSGAIKDPNRNNQIGRLDDYRGVFGDRAYLVAEQLRGPDDRALLARLVSLSRASQLPLVAANDVHFHDPDRRDLQDVLTAVRFRCTVEELGERRFFNAERCLKSPQRMGELFAACPEAIARTVEIAGRCRFSLDELRYDYPEELCPRGMTPGEYLRRLTWEGAADRYPHGLPDKVRRLLEHELALIAELNYEAYFLTVWDLMRFARGRGILCQGRGSAANSAVCYCLGVTSVNPDQIEVLFERFLSKERNEAPDIDVDFEHERREEVLQYVYEKYGRERAGMTAEVITYRPRSAVRDVGKALGLSLDQVGRLSSVLEHYRQQEDTFEKRFREAGIDPQSRMARQLQRLIQELLGFPRHLSQHVGGMVLSHRPLCEIVPIENAAMAGRTVIQWDKNDLDALGILKVDCLALGMLTAIRKAFGLIGETYGRRLTLATVPAEDPAVYEMICRADTMGVFQIESRAQMSMLPRLKPNSYYDLVIEVAIVRPGPIQGDMVHPYLRRRCGEERVTYPSEEVRAVLTRTLGVPLFQEQAMRLAIVAAGFTAGEADQLRRAMGAWRKTGVMDRFRNQLIQGMRERGYTDQFAENLFNQIRGFGEYGFPESHAASFALLVYVSCWIKRYFPEAFLAALINSQPMGFYAPAQLVTNARQHGVQVRPVDVNASHWECTLESPESHRSTEKLEDRAAVRLGFCLVGGLSSAAAEQIVRARAAGPFRSVAEFTRRTRLTRSVVTRLARADAFGSLRLDRRQSLWQALEHPEQGPLDDRPEDATSVGFLTPMPAWEQVLADYRTTGVSLRAHPLAFLRSGLAELGVTPARDLAQAENERRIAVAGLVLLRQRPGTAAGITFVTLEDETGMANLIVYPGVWEKFHAAARTARLMLARGVLQRQHGIIHVLVERIEDLSGWITSQLPTSRDFR